jgi:RimJ/RimL family protein N-acetyltransferase
MQTVRSKIPKQRIRLDCGEYLVRTVTIDDASDRWGAWMTDPEASQMLNAPPRRMRHNDVVSYIKSFDQRSHILLGIFEKGTWKHLGIIRADIDYELSRCLISVLIGEPEYRNRGVATDISDACARNTFVTLGLDTMVAHALAHNRPVINLLLKEGWMLEETLPGRIKSHADGTMLDLCVFTLSKETWLAQQEAKRRPDPA